MFDSRFRKRKDGQARWKHSLFLDLKRPWWLKHSRLSNCDVFISSIEPDGEMDVIDTGSGAACGTRMRHYQLLCVTVAQRG